MARYKKLGRKKVPEEEHTVKITATIYKKHEEMLNEMSAGETRRRSAVIRDCIERVYRALKKHNKLPKPLKNTNEE